MRDAIHPLSREAVLSETVGADSPAPTLRTLQLSFPHIPLFPRLIPQWRGAVVETAGRDADIFHNHRPEGPATLHRPALIHYRCAGGHAVLWGMNEGADALLRWHGELSDAIYMGGRAYATNPVALQRSRQTLEIEADWHYYRIKDYLALNTQNYRAWLGEHRLLARMKMLEQALAAHLLAFCQAAGFWLPAHLEVELVEWHGYQKTRYHGVEMVSFELTYRTKLALPDGVALGKAVSHGFGVQGRAPRY